MTRSVRWTLILAGVLFCAFVVAAAAFVIVVPRLASPVGLDRYPAPSVRLPTGCDAFVVLGRVPQPLSMRETEAALAEARKPWSQVDRTKLAGVERLGLGPAAEAFATARSCPAFEDQEVRAVLVHQVLRAALVTLVARELAVPGSARADLLDYARLTALRAHSARSALGLVSALAESTEVVQVLVRAGIQRAAEPIARKSDGGRVVRFKLAECRQLVTTTRPSLGFDPGRTYDGCVQALGPWIEHFEHGAPQPPELGIMELSLRNRDGDRVIDAYGLGTMMYPKVTRELGLLETAEAAPPDPRVTP